MTSPMPARRAGFLLVVGAAAFVVHLAARSYLTAGPDLATVAREGLWIPVNALGAVAAALVLVALPAVHARIAAPLGALGRAGIVCIALGWMFFGLFLSLFSALIAPWLAEHAPGLLSASARLPAAFLVTFVLALLAEVTGAALLAVPFLTRRLPPRWLGFVLLASAAMLMAGVAIAPAGPSDDIAVNLVSNLGPALLMFALGVLGWRAWTEVVL